MKLTAEWKRISSRAHSMWAFYLSAAALVAPDLIYLLSERDTNPRFWWWLAFGLLIYGIIGRLVDQGIDRTKLKSGSAAALAAFLAVAVPHVGKWEGKENQAYLDRIASPPVWTVCYGETRGVKAGDYHTDAECSAMLAAGLKEYRESLHKYFTTDTKLNRLPATRDAAYVSLAWNVGIRAAGKSTATRRLNAGNIKGGCAALGWWNRAGGRVIRGLVNRRADEVDLCLHGSA